MSKTLKCDFGGKKGHIWDCSIKAKLLSTPELGGPELVSRLIRYTWRAIFKETRLKKNAFICPTSPLRLLNQINSNFAQAFFVPAIRS